MSDALIKQLRLSPGEEYVLAELVERTIADANALNEALSSAPSARRTRTGHPTGSIRQTICTLRRKLAPLGVEIVTQRFRGWWISDADKRKLARAVEA